MKLQNIFRFVAYTLPILLLTPILVSAQSTNFTYVGGLFTDLNSLFKDILLPLIMSIAVVVFFWNVMRYFIWSANDPDARTEARAYMLYALIGLVLIVAVWGIVALLIEILGVNAGTTPPPLPQLP